MWTACTSLLRTTYKNNLCDKKLNINRNKDITNCVNLNVKLSWNKIILIKCNKCYNITGNWPYGFKNIGYLYSLNLTSVKMGFTFIC